MLMGQFDMGSVIRAYYTEVPHPNDPEMAMKALRVEVRHKGHQEVVDIPNSDFTLDNLALQFMAYCGVRPSNLEEIGNKTFLPLVDDPALGVAVPDMVFEQGRRILEEAAWGPNEGRMVPEQ